MDDDEDEKEDYLVTDEVGDDNEASQSAAGPSTPTEAGTRYDLRTENSRRRVEYMWNSYTNGSLSHLRSAQRGVGIYCDCDPEHHTTYTFVAHRGLTSPFRSDIESVSDDLSPHA
ncbi:hypothetical protein PIB30_095428 [Stylosanthes scabra]|uniref:Uncharacterized protein n=1 Tax=Stylosanthes scabra TaxID=79078 RepID=A0ABU6RW18_9FABA|nr:hypothetical protein [Stylosanthes scabra]